MNTETKAYSDGTVATGPAPLPLQSPTQQEHVAGLVEDYGQWMWDAGYMDDPRGEVLVDDAAHRRKEIKDAVDAAQQHAYAEGRKDEAEDRSRAAIDVLGERARQVSEEGYTREHDDACHTPAELTQAAICYADIGGVLSQADFVRIWPWMPTAWKPKHVRRDLVRATALMLAAIESGDRDGWMDFGGAE